MKLRIEKIKSSFLEPGELILDIESSGFSRTNDFIYLIGLQDADSIKQILIERPEEEKNLIKEALISMAGKKIYSYNGDAFDLPFIRTRAEKYKLVCPPFESRDFYAYFRKKQKFFDFPDLKLQTMERLAGIDRKDEMSGKEVSWAFYKIVGANTDSKKDNEAEPSRQYKDLLDKVLGHNYEDIFNLGLLMPFFEDLRGQLDIENPFKGYIEEITYNGDYCQISFKVKNEQGQRMDYLSDFGQLSLINMQLILNFRFHTLVLGDKKIKALVSPGQSPDHSSAKLPMPFLALEVDNKYIAENIKSFLSDLYKHFIENAG